MAQIDYNHKKYYLGRYDDEVFAASRYNEEAIKLHGKFASLNTIEMYLRTKPKSEEVV